eukprot:scaffold84105_cov60-Phaeocystis_antarctica.AAC.1
MRPSQRITGPDGEESLIIIISSPQTYPSRRLEPVRPMLVRLMKRVWRPWISARGGDTMLLSSLFKALWLTCETLGSTSDAGALDAAGADNSAVGATAASGALGTAAFFAARAFASRLCFWSRSELGLTFSLSSATRLVVRQRRCDSLCRSRFSRSGSTSAFRCGGMSMCCIIKPLFRRRSERLKGTGRGV